MGRGVDPLPTSFLRSAANPPAFAVPPVVALGARIAPPVLTTAAVVNKAAIAPL